MSTHREPQTQLGDATVHRCSGGGFFGVGDVDLTVHQAHGTFMKVGVHEGTTIATARFKVNELPDLIRTLIARTDLTLHQAEPPTNDDSVHVNVNVDVPAKDAVRAVRSLTTATQKGVV